uniref:Uncharacterized protein n=1 Tax=Timema monikensis TaxID=170555 RepID=A0A7R9EFG1_9NEOP|nr:unnamed protein product [Timema monikensis]
MEDEQCVESDIQEEQIIASVLWPSENNDERFLVLLRQCGLHVESGCELKSVIHQANSLRKVFLKAPSRIFSFKAALPNIPLPPHPVLTRWGTWLHAVLYYEDYLGDIQKVVQTFDEEQAVAITEANTAISCSSVSADLAYVKSNFGNLPGSTTALEASDLPLVKAVKIMRGIEENLNQASASFGTAIVDKFNRVLQRNPGWKAGYAREITAASCTSRKWLVLVGSKKYSGDRSTRFRWELRLHLGHQYLGL